jgi:hypothetical protein
MNISVADQETPKSLADQYQSLEGYRTTYIDRAEAAAEITIPHLFPRRGTTSGTDFITPYQSIGASGVNGLASKLLLALLPPNAPFFRLLIDDVKAAQEGLDGATRQELDKALANVEREVLKDIESSGFRNTLYGALRQLVLTGNTLIYIQDEGTRVFKLSDYVIERDPIGQPLRIITKESVGIDTVGEDIRLKAQEKDSGAREVTLHTIAELKGNKWVTYQELNDEEVEGSRGSYKKSELPYLALRWSKIDGEHYGRGYIEEYIGDLNSAEGLSKAILEGAAAAARVLFMIEPNSNTNIRDLAQTENGGFCYGKADSVQALQVGKQADMSVAMQVLNGLKDKLSQAFLSGASSVRNAERVTAQEIRMITQELESTLGGLYSILATDLQLPLVNIKLAKLKKEGKIGDLPKEIVKPAIVTGMDALGRGNDLQKLEEFIGGAIQQFGEAAIQYINVGEYMSRKAKSLGIDEEGLVKDPDQIAEEENQKMMQGMTEQALPQVVGGIANQQQQ